MSNKSNNYTTFAIALLILVVVMVFAMGSRG